MIVRIVIVTLLAMPVMGSLTVPLGAEAAPQTRRSRPAPARPATNKPTQPSPTRPTPPGVVREAPLMQCPSVLGNGMKSQRLFCDILTGADPTTGLRVSVPPHQGPATLLFTLHNRQTLPEEPSKGGVVFARYTASLRIVTANGTLLRQTVVQSEFRGPSDLVERIGGGGGPGGVKAVAPTGSEPLAVELPPDVTEVSLLGEKLIIERLDGTETVTAPGRPIAVVSQVQVEYRPPASTGARPGV